VYRELTPLSPHMKQSMVDKRIHWKLHKHAYQLLGQGRPEQVKRGEWRGEAMKTRVWQEKNESG
jgi:hypothetical protein